jgi:hypothetical protein
MKSQRGTGWHHEQSHEVGRLIGLGTLAVVPCLAGRASAVLAGIVAEPFAGRSRVRLARTAITGHRGRLSGSHLQLTATDVRYPRQPVAGQRQHRQ